MTAASPLPLFVNDFALGVGFSKLPPPAHALFWPLVCPVKAHHPAPAMAPPIFNCRTPSPQSIVLKLFPAKKSILSLFERLMQRQFIPKSEQPCSDRFSKEKGLDRTGTNRNMAQKGLRGRHKRLTDFTASRYGSDILVQLLSLSFQQRHPTKAPHRASTGHNRALTKQVDFLLSIFLHQSGESDFVYIPIVL